MKKLKKHRKVEKDYEKLKSKHLERLATEILKKDEINYGTQFWNSSLKSFTSNHQIGDLANKFRKNYTKTIKSLFEQNVLYGFVRNNKSWHSVEPTKISDEYIRKSININFNF